jgi:ribulose-5-phosphate 4-epimerase/fuculose-1-phosphate aldolase
MSTEVISQQVTSPPLVRTSDPKPKLTSTRFEDQGFASPVKIQFDDSHEEREYMKGRLTAAFRIFGHFRLNEGAAGHISVRDPIDPETFWVNPFWLDFNLIKNSDLLRVNHKGEVLNHGRKKTLNKAALIIHVAIHAARPDVLCAAHTHSIYGRAFCLLRRLLNTSDIHNLFKKKLCA